MNKGNKFYCIVKILLFLLIGNAFPAFAQSGLEMSVSGFVRDINSNLPIPGVQIIIVRSEQGSLTDIFIETSDKNGFFKVRYLQAGNYIFRLKSPENMILGSTLEPKNFDKLVIKEGMNVNLNVFLGESEISSFEKSVSMDGARIIFNILYDKTLYQEIEALKKEGKFELSDKALDTTGYGELKILGPYPIEVEDDYIIIDSDGDKCDSAIEYGFPKIDYYEIICNKDEPGGTCYCSFISLKCYIVTKLYIHKRTYWEKRYPNANKNCIDCIMDCVLLHEWTHKELMDEFIQNKWNSLKNRLKEGITDYCCDNDKVCKLVCRQKLLKVQLELYKAYIDYAPKTENEAMEKYRKCITYICNKIETCDKVKTNSP
ncbi:MAG: carboxypeptidase regulatory-like domain-containing protein [Candidatus Aminicenantes bacterium]|nr:MAG: carboxypeptidase regulatory-like domain-containing protein [Candidatus Aminicenantes bacterium]